MFKGLVLLICSILVSCSGIKVQVNNNNFDQETNSTFAWLWEPMKSNAVRESNEIIFDQVLRKQLNKQLTKKGYQQTSRESADFLVSYNFSTKMLGAIDAGKVAAVDPTKEWIRAGNIRNGTFHTYESFGAYERGSLIINLEERSGKIIWQGAVSKLIEYQDAGASTVDKILNKSLKKLLVYLPVK